MALAALRSSQRPRSRRQRGNVSIVFALTLPILLWFMAMVADLGHGWQVRNQLQNAADGAALAGVRDLNGSANGLTNVATDVQTVAQAHNANGTSVSINASDIHYGNWDFTTRTWTELGSSYTPVSSINAIKVTASRDSSTSTVATWFASALGGTSSMSVTATAIAAGGGPSAPSTCGWPFLISKCALVDSSGNFTCPGSMTFNGSNNNIGLTVYTTASPVNGNMVEAYIQQALAGNCTNYDLNNGAVWAQNGADPTQNTINMINNAITANGGAPIEADIAVVNTDSCDHPIFNQSMNILGYLHIQITGGTWPSPKAIDAVGKCGVSSTNGLPGGGYYGEWSTNPYIVQ